MAAAVASLHVYPVKGARGTDLAAAELTPRGIRHDREFMVVTPAGRLVSQREQPRLALVRPAYDGATLDLRAPDMADLMHRVVRDGPRVPVRVHSTDSLGVDQGETAAAWIGEYLRGEYRLVRFPDEHVRPTTVGNGQVAFADGYPLLVTSRSSLDALNQRLDEALPMNRFRPSIVVDGWPDPFTEDTVRRMRVGGHDVDLVKPCGRCEVTTIDQATAQRGKEPLFALALFRNIDHELVFGVNAVPRTFGTVRVGDPVEIVDRTTSPMPA